MVGNILIPLATAFSTSQPSAHAGDGLPRKQPVEHGDAEVSRRGNAKLAQRLGQPYLDDPVNDAQFPHPSGPASAPPSPGCAARSRIGCGLPPGAGSLPAPGTEVELPRSAAPSPPAGYGRGAAGRCRCRPGVRAIAGDLGGRGRSADAGCPAGGGRGPWPQRDRTEQLLKLVQRQVGRVAGARGAGR